MTEPSGKKRKPARRQRTAAKAAERLLRRALRQWRRFYGPFDAACARFLDYVAADDKRRRRSAFGLALAINLVVLTALAVFGRVRIWIPNAPSDTINVTLVEMMTPETLSELRDPVIEPESEPEVIEPEPEPEPEIVEEPEPEPEPEPDPVPQAEPPAESEAEPEPEIIEEEPEPEQEPEPEPEPEPEIVLDLEPELAPPAEDPEPFIPEPVPVARDDIIFPEPQEEVVEQSPAEEAPEPLVSVEPEQFPEPGLDELVGDEEGAGEDAAGEDEEAEEETPEGLPEEPIVEEQVTGDDMFDEEPSFTGRRFVLPQVQLPLGEAPVDPGSSGVIAIFCPEQFSDEDKAEECAGRTELRSGWRPGDSGEDWSRAIELLKSARERGEFGPDMDKLVGPAAARRLEDERIMRGLSDPRRSMDSVNNLPDAGDDNLMGGVEANRPAIGPAPFEPSWTLREDGELSPKEIEELEKALEEAEENK